MFRGLVNYFPCYTVGHKFQDTESIIHPSENYSALSPPEKIQRTSSLYHFSFSFSFGHLSLSLSLSLYVYFIVPDPFTPYSFTPLNTCPHGCSSKIKNVKFQSLRAVAPNDSYNIHLWISGLCSL